MNRSGFVLVLGLVGVAILGAATFGFVRAGKCGCCTRTAAPIPVPAEAPQVVEAQPVQLESVETIVSEPIAVVPEQARSEAAAPAAPPQQLTLRSVEAWRAPSFAPAPQLAQTKWNSQQLAAAKLARSQAPLAQTLGAAKAACIGPVASIAPPRSKTKELLAPGTKPLPVK